MKLCVLLNESRGEWHLYDEKGQIICCDVINKANANHIVKCVNMHDELVATLEELRNEYGNTVNRKLADDIDQLLKRARE